MCPVCKTKIGGIAYKLAEGNSIVHDVQEKQQHGYCIPGDASKRPDSPESIRNIGSLNSIIIRLILDCTLYMSAIKRAGETKKLLMDGGNKRTDVAQYFADHIVKDVKILANCLQHSPEESLLLVHFMLNKIKLDGKIPDVSLKSKEDRNKYEKILCQDMIELIVGNDSGKIIQQMTNVLAEDAKNSGSNQLFRIAYDQLSPQEQREGDDENTITTEFFNDKKFW